MADLIKSTDSLNEGRKKLNAIAKEMNEKDVVSSPEIINARNGEPSLKARLDGEHADLTAQLQQKASQAELNTEKGRINNLIANAGNTDDNAELLDIRVGWDGVSYPTAGDAVRSLQQFLTEENQIWEV